MPVAVPFQQYASSLAAYRVLFYSVFSLGAVAAVIVNALRRHSNFYSMAVYLSKSNGTIVVMANFGILLALLAGKLLQQVFFGPLRPTEVERLYDRMWFFVTESLLAFTIFRDEFDIPFALMFGFLLFTKCFHWLLSDRIEWMDQRPYPGPPVLFHIRIQALIALLWCTDVLFFMFMIESMISNGVGGSVLFGSEYAILLASLGNSIAKYIIALLDLRRASQRGGENAPPWEDKSMLIFYVELVTDFVKLVTYMTFFMLVLTFYGLPLNIIRDVYITARSFIIRFRDLLRYRTATRNMDERYPNATEAELSGSNDGTCIICRDEMTPAPAQTGNNNEAVHDGTRQEATSQQGPNTTPKKLPCGHIFHFYCLRSWLERQQSCPTCRRSVLEEDRNQGRANRPQGPQRAQPAVAPQAAPNGNPLMQWQQHVQANNGGFLGRLMGGANMPPVLNGPMNPNIPLGQPPHQNGNAAGQLHFPQNPLGVFGMPQEQRPERFAGFFGPDGVWHPWVQPAVEQANGQPNVPGPTQQAPRSEEQVPSSSDAQGGGESTSQSDTSSEERKEHNAREAARAAALRRFGSQTRPSSEAQASSAPPSTSNLESPAPTKTSRSDSEVAQVSNGESPSSSLGPRITAPALIPLYDPYLQSPPSGHMAPTPTTSAGTRASTTHTQSGGLREFDLQNLPPVVTDEPELRTMDRLTREAIDARLRVLENIQNAAAQMSVDLLRCRSMFPPLNDTINGPQADARRSREEAGRAS